MGGSGHDEGHVRTENGHSRPTVAGSETSWERIPGSSDVKEMLAPSSEHCPSGALQV